MDTKREILSVKFPLSKFVPWVDENRGLIIGETVKAAEELIHNNIDTLAVMEISLTVPDTELAYNMTFSISKADIETGIGRLLQKSIELEEYELSHRIKLLIDYIEERKDT